MFAEIEAGREANNCVPAFVCEFVPTTISALSSLGAECDVTLHIFLSTLQSAFTKCGKHWYKYYSGGWCTWPTPLKYAESKFKYTEA